MRERHKMLLSIPLWVPAACAGAVCNYLLYPGEFKFHWQELKRIIRWAWQN